MCPRRRSFIGDRMAALREGMTAMIEGLVARADLNGKRVTLHTFSDGRWGTTPTNLVP